MQTGGDSFQPDSKGKAQARMVRWTRPERADWQSRKCLMVQPEANDIGEGEVVAMSA